MTDPVEKMLAGTMDEWAVSYQREVPLPQNVRALDFYLPELDVYIECKQFHSERTIRQLAGLENVILVQGKQAGKSFCEILRAWARTKLE